METLNTTGVSMLSLRLMMDLQTKMCTRVSQMFMRFGIKSVSMDDISRDLGISKKTLYALVPNKAELVATILYDWMQEEHRQIAAIKATAKDPIYELVLIAKHVTRMLKKISPTTMYDLRKYYRDVWRKMESSRDDMIFSNIKENLEEGIEASLYRDDLDIDLVTTLYVKMATYITDEKILDVARPKKLSLFIEFVKYHIRGIATKKGMRALEKYEHLLNED